MKKLVLVLAIVFAGVISANAQGWWIGGGVNASIYKNHTQFGIAPEIGYNINNHWTVALGAGYGFNQNKLIDPLTNDEIKTTFHDLTLQPYVRYVGGTIGHKFSLFLDLTGDLDFGNMINGIDNTMGWAVSLRPGIAWAATERFTAAFRFGFAGYNRGFYKDENGAALPNGFFLNCETFTPEIRFYYSL